MLLGSGLNSWFGPKIFPIAIQSWRVPICRFCRRSLHNLVAPGTVWSRNFLAHRAAVPFVKDEQTLFLKTIIQPAHPSFVANVAQVPTVGTTSLSSRGLNTAASLVANPRPDDWAIGPGRRSHRAFAS